MESIYCDSHVVTMPEGDAISYTMKPTRMYPADEVADLAKRGLKYLPSKTKWLHSQPYQLHHGDCNIEDWNNELTECKCGLFQYIAELEQIVEESA